MKSRKRGLSCSRTRPPSLSTSGSLTNTAFSQVVPGHKGNMTVLHQDYFPETLPSLGTSLLPKSTSRNQQCPEQAMMTRRSRAFRPWGPRRLLGAVQQRCQPSETPPPPHARTHAGVRSLVPFRSHWSSRPLCCSAPWHITSPGCDTQSVLV